MTDDERYQILRGRETVCGNKHKYYRYSKANLVALSVYQCHDEEMVPYKCYFCGSYHVGHKPDIQGFLRRYEQERIANGDWLPAVPFVMERKPMKTKEKVDPSAKRMIGKVKVYGISAEAQERAIRHEEHQRIVSKHWQRACDDGWNQHLG